MNHRQFGPRTNGKEKGQVRKPLGPCMQPQPARGTLWGLPAQPPGPGADPGEALYPFCSRPFLYSAPVHLRPCLKGTGVVSRSGP